MKARLFRICCLVAVVTGCIGMDPTPIAEMRPTGTPFELALHAEYANLALAESARYDWSHATHFARKAEAAAFGQAVEPEMPGIWGVPTGSRAQLESARGRLVGLLQGSRVRDVAPVPAARAQVALDCWVEEASEGQASDIDLCRNRWRMAMAELESVLRPPLVQPAAAPEIATFAIEPLRSSRQYEVFFELGQTGPDPSITRLVADIADEANADGHRRIVVAGHADRTGPRELNERLSRKRAETVAMLLMRSGVSRERILTEAFGEADPAVPTSDGVEQPLNRRVVIQLL